MEAVSPEVKKARQRQTFIKQRLLELKEEHASLVEERKKNKEMIDKAQAEKQK